MNVNTVFLMSRKKNYIYFDYDEDTKICHLGHAFTVEKNSNIAGSGIFIFETPIGKYLYSSKIFMFQIFSWKCTIFMAIADASIAQRALVTMGADDDLTLVFSTGEVCQSQDHGIPPLPPEETLVGGKVSKMDYKYLRQN